MNSFHILKGIGIISLGLFAIWHAYKYPVLDIDSNNFNYGRYLSGIVCVILGIFYLLK